ncbi:MAG: L-fucose:H+ symporter permease [Bacteroidales bacterium]|nr:L-fucose:H+ symporter permease [Bacteroidales bacterium]
MAKNGKNNKKILFGIITMLFVFWGLANNMTGALLSAFDRVLQMTEIQQYFIEYAFYVAYFCFAVPSALFIIKRSYKSGIILGLVLYATGAIMFFPAAGISNYTFYLVAVYIMAGGCSLLETVANPYILVMQDSHEEGVKKLNLAQAFNPLGIITGILMSRFLVTQNMPDVNPEIIVEELDAVTLVYAIVGQALLVFMVILIFMNVPSFGTEKLEKISFGKAVKKLAKNKVYVFGLVTEFFYLGAQVGSWGFANSATESAIKGTDVSLPDITFWTIAAFAIARFAFTFLMNYFQPEKLLLFASTASLLFSLIVMFGSGYIVIIAVLGISVCMSLMFSTIFANALEGTTTERLWGASFLVMSISGGAVFPPLQDYISDNYGVQAAFAIPAVCFTVVMSYSLYLLSNKQQVTFKFDFGLEENDEEEETEKQLN